jgi:hypothetical protein
MNMPRIPSLLPHPVICAPLRLLSRALLRASSTLPIVLTLAFLYYVTPTRSTKARNHGNVETRKRIPVASRSHGTVETGKHATTETWFPVTVEP